MNLLRFLIFCLEMYRQIGPNGAYYGAVKNNGVPKTTMLIGTGREAWQVAEFAAHYFESKNVEPQPTVQ